MTTIMDYALTYASKKWLVFPLRPKDKTPAVKWADVATTEPNMICGWWEREPNANVGIVTGIKSNLLVLDIDEGHGGIESLKTLVNVYGELPNTPIAITGGGGRHIFFKYAAGTKNTASKIAQGIDTRSEGGYVVGSGSIHPNGNEYRWDEKYNPETTPLADAPQWLIKLLLAEQAQPTTPAIIDGNAAIINGGRNNTLASMAGAMRRKGFDEASIYQALLIENKTKCIPPMTDTEVEQIAQSVTRYAPAVEFEQRDRVKVEWCFVKSLYDFPTNIPDFLQVSPDAFVNHSLRDWWAGILHGEDMGTLTMNCGLLADMENFKDYDAMKVDAYARAVVRFGYLAKVARYADNLLMAARKGDDPAIDKTINEMNTNITSTGRGVISVSDIAESLEVEILERQKNPQKIWGIPYAWDYLSELTGGKQAGELTLFVAEPKTGKSWWNLQDIVETAIKNIPVFYWCGEMKRLQIVRRLYQLMGVNGRNMKSGMMTERDWDYLSDAKALILNSPLYIDDRPIALHEVRPLLARQKAEHGIRQAVFDYARLIQAPGRDENEQSKEISLEFKRICQDLDLAITLIASVNKQGMDNKTEYASKSNVSGSGQQIHDADNVYIMTKFDGAKHGLLYNINASKYDSTRALHLTCGRELDKHLENGFIPYMQDESPKFDEILKLHLDGFGG